jgi:tetraacyldisaccharide 4'-kinase
MNLLLRPLSLLYHCVTALRNYVYDKGLVSAYQCPLPVVSVGNLSVGGNGKTPLVLFLVEELVRRGFEPVVLSRGYGGKFGYAPSIQPQKWEMNRC